jgi:ATP-binding cassette subfamily C protein
MRGALTASLALLPPGDRRRYVLAIVAQALTALLDFVGVLLIGVVALLSVSAPQGDPPPDALQRAADAVGLGDASTASLALAAALAAGIILIGKSALSALVASRTLAFLASRQAAVGSSLTARLFAETLTVAHARSSLETAHALTAGVGAAIVGLLGAVAIGVGELAMMTVLTALLLLVNPLLTVVMVGYFAVIALVLQRFMGARASAIARQTATWGILSSATIQEGLTSFREIAAADRRESYSAQVQEGLQRSARARADALFLQQIPKYVLEGALILGAVALTASQLVVGSSAAAVATLAVFIAAATRFMPSLLRVQAALIAIRSSEGEARTAYSLAQDLPAAGVPLPEASAGVVLRDRIEAGYADFTPTVDIRDLTFTYPGTARPAVASVSLTVPAGSSLALVGSTGAGKSTLADLMLGLLTPQSGSVHLGGLPAAEAVHRWPGGIAYVPQAVGLVDGSVRRNVGLGLPDDCIDDARVWRALRQARLDDVIAERADGLDSPVGERGVLLSGGQRQRLGLARALYSAPRLLILDEATSALDAETEQAIADVLAGLGEQLTTVTIAHRLSTVRSAGLVAYLDEGRLAAVGTFDEVRALLPAFDRQADLMGVPRGRS